MLKPEIGIISFDNVRTDSSGGRTKDIRSGYVESFVTSPEVVIGRATAQKAVWAANKFVVMLNSNEGSLSIDLLNRSLPIRLTPTGDVTQRKSPIGNPKLEYLPANRRQIEAERWGMIERWVKVLTALKNRATFALENGPPSSQHFFATNVLHPAAEGICGEKMFPGTLGAGPRESAKVASFESAVDR